MTIELSKLVSLSQILESNIRAFSVLDRELRLAAHSGFDSPIIHSGLLAICEQGRENNRLAGCWLVSFLEEVDLAARGPLDEDIVFLEKLANLEDPRDNKKEENATETKHTESDGDISEF